MVFLPRGRSAGWRQIGVWPPNPPMLRCPTEGRGCRALTWTDTHQAKPIEPMITIPALRVLAGAALCGAMLTLIAVSAARADHYSTTVLQDQPLAYYRLNDSLQRANVNRNSGTSG